MDLRTSFELFGILIGFLIGFFSYRIFINTRGGSRGWKYIAIGSFSFFVWALIQVIFTLIWPLEAIRIFAGFLTWSLIAALLPLGYMQLNLDFGKEMPRFFRPKAFLITFGIFWLVLLLINLIMPFDSILYELAGISLVTLTVFAWVGGVYPAYRLWWDSKNWMFLMLFLFVLLIPFGTGLGAYTHGCCFSEDVPACNQITTQYANVLYIPCIEGILNIGAYYNLLEMPIILILAAGLIGLWKKLR
ncbi:MAG: hypothetical protein R6V53_02835 [Candidatus Woesearchaeota archaeon]